MVGCCPISDLFGKGEPILGEGKRAQYLCPLRNKSDIGQAADQTAVLFIIPVQNLSLCLFNNYEK